MHKFIRNEVYIHLQLCIQEMNRMHLKLPQDPDCMKFYIPHLCYLVPVWLKYFTLQTRNANFESECRLILSAITGLYTLTKILFVRNLYWQTTGCLLNFYMIIRKRIFFLKVSSLCRINRQLHYLNQQLNNNKHCHPNKSPISFLLLYCWQHLLLILA